MTVSELVGVLIRRSYVVVIGVALTAVAGLTLLRPSPLHWTQVDVVFVGPGEAASGSSNETNTESLVAFAGVVERELNGRPVQRLSSPSAPIYGAGIREGTSIVLPNLGGQWQNSFRRPVLSVQAVDATPEAVLSRLAAAMERIQLTTTRVQDELAVPEAARITFQTAPADPVVSYVGQTGAGRARVVLAVGALGAALTVAAAVEADRFLRRREDRRRQVRPGRRARKGPPAVTAAQRRATRPPG